MASTDGHGAGQASSSLCTSELENFKDRLFFAKEDMSDDCEGAQDLTTLATFFVWFHFMLVIHDHPCRLKRFEGRRVRGCEGVKGTTHDTTHHAPDKLTRTRTERPSETEIRQLRPKTRWNRTRPDQTVQTVQTETEPRQTERTRGKETETYQATNGERDGSADRRHTVRDGPAVRRTDSQNDSSLLSFACLQCARSDVPFRKNFTTCHQVFSTKSFFCLPVFEGFVMAASSLIGQTPICRNMLSGYTGDVICA